MRPRPSSCVAAGELWTYSGGWSDPLKWHFVCCGCVDRRLVMLSLEGVPRGPHNSPGYVWHVEPSFFDDGVERAKRMPAAIGWRKLL
jgi:hypothetical protein